jgi:integrase
MAPRSGGGVTAETLGDGTLAFRLRFRAYGKRRTVYLHELRDCDCGCGGGWNERTAKVELETIVARVKAGVWSAPKRRTQRAVPSETGAPTFHEYSSRWLQARIDGVIGEKPIRHSTAEKYRWRIESHLLPFFARYRLDEIDRELCLAFKAHLLRQSSELRQALDAGTNLRDPQGKRMRPLSAASMRMVVDGLVAILDDAVEDGHIDSNPARGRRMRIRVPKPTRTFLELDELAALIDAAAEQDISRGPGVAPIDLGLTAAQVAQLHHRGRTPTQIARRLGLAKSTVAFHLKNLGLRVGRAYVGRQVVIELLGRGGPRASELCDIKIGHLRLHDPEGARFRIPDAKTETGIREVQMTPDLVQSVVKHIDRLRRMGAPTGPENYLVPDLRGTRMSYGRVEEIVRDAAARASKQLTTRGLPPLPHTTPHTLRRTYISIELLANNYDVKWVMSQVGHADSKMTLDVYAQLQQRAKRDRGVRFDELVRDARRQLHGTNVIPATGMIGTAIGTEGQKRPPRRPRRGHSLPVKSGGLQGANQWAILDSNQGPLPISSGRDHPGIA